MVRPTSEKKKRPEFLERWRGQLTAVIEAPRLSSTQNFESVSPLQLFGTALWTFGNPIHKWPAPIDLFRLDELREAANVSKNYLDVILTKKYRQQIEEARRRYVSRIYDLLFDPKEDLDPEKDQVEAQRELLKISGSISDRVLKMGGSEEQSEKLLERIFMVCYLAGSIVEEHRAVRQSWKDIYKKRVLAEQKRDHSAQTLALKRPSLPPSMEGQIEEWKQNTIAFYKALRDSRSSFLRRREKTVLLEAGIALINTLETFYPRHRRQRTHLSKDGMPRETENAYSVASRLLEHFHPHLWNRASYDSLRQTHIAHLNGSRKSLQIF